MGELDIDNAAVKRAAGVVALVCRAGVAAGFVMDVSWVELFVTTSSRDADSSPGLVNGAVEFVAADVTVPSAWDTDTSGSITWDGVESRVAVVGAASSAVGNNPAKMIMVVFKWIVGIFTSNSPRKVLRLVDCQRSTLRDRE